jgi:hypothetical protein
LFDPGRHGLHVVGSHVEALGEDHGVRHRLATVEDKLVFQAVK